ncbi:conserved hypothetical protein [Vibrio phage 150E35-1]|nr:conserved hypothetical protein [Vibrio phage 150E35-1]
MSHPLIPSRDVRWGLGKFFTWYGTWTNWGGGYEIADTNETFDALSSTIIDQLLEIEPRETYTVTTDEFRPDLIAYKIYGHTMYWQVLMVYNGILSVGDLVAGTALRYPSLQSLENLLLSNRSNTTSVVGSSSIPTVSDTRTIRYTTDKLLYNEGHEYNEQVVLQTYRLDDGSIVK